MSMEAGVETSAEKGPLLLSGLKLFIWISEFTSVGSIYRIMKSLQKRDPRITRVPRNG